MNTKSLKREDLLAYLQVLNYGPSLEELSFSEIEMGLRHIPGCLSRISDALSAIEYQETYYGNYGHPIEFQRLMALKKTIELREFYNAKLLLPNDDPVLVSMTQATATSITAYLRHTNELEVDTDVFLSKFDKEMDKILHSDTKVKVEKTDFVKESKSELKKRIDALFAKGDTLKEAYQKNGETYYRTWRDEAEIERLNAEKEKAVRNEKFDEAAGFREQADKLKKKPKNPHGGVDDYDDFSNAKDPFDWRRYDDDWS